MNKRLLTRLRAASRNVRTSTTVLLWVFSITSIALFIASFCVPPMGVIDPSVIKGVAWLFAFAALIEGREAILEGLGVKLTHGQTTIEVHDIDGKPSPDAGGNTDEDAEDTPTP